MPRSSLPQELRNSIGPDVIKTDINKQTWETTEAEASLLRLIPHGRVGETADIWHVAVWLASNEPNDVTGTTIFIDIGMCCIRGFPQAADHWQRFRHHGGEDERSAYYSRRQAVGR
ncbi:MAG TPA: SDR family oxidoreductase [Nitrospirota bacterium]|nr:SDR family oxidoreductase [Nitrospirota bacterium]